MKPIDPRLLRHAGAPVAAIIILGAINTALVIAQALILSGTLARAFHADTTGLATACAHLSIVIAARVAVTWLLEIAGHHASATAKTRIRQQILRHALTLGPAWLNTQRSTDLATLATRGINALDDYFAKYLPQLILAVITPLAILAVVTPTDHLAGITIAVTLPLIPIFMALIGLATSAATSRRWETLNRLGHHFLDVIAGLPTLKIFGRAHAQTNTIATITHSYRRATMETLRLAFLSALALELLATLSVALVAVGIGLRLVNGNLT
ncbi:MAG: thiol reductant ABC exporter subunit CydD, partial [Longispora sp.]|nr:thiol reductant ABC exporter subunit CydD [Longispora sp. (in: high G+C Gram-positive bacteria)]